ncbi:MAG: bifunctional methylenetetrahydrofolate dehydrogenase/methenyltetrahydrofolate cyclohydrolase FolD [Erysipelotrichaceae bacterium]|nr:bifunctional methylenetetrahydrofolate dehydrogenase/methenyltetrahydrofolate cyclohydrolase FolD [Erysipelotrichaceae bacterium]
MGTVIYGSELSAELKEEIRQEISWYTSRGRRAPKLAVILVGNNPASLSYIKGKKKAAEQVGIDLEVTHLSEDASQDELEAHIRICNEDPDTDGILIQLPLPKGLDDDRAVALVDPEKDVDGLHPVNVGRLHLGLPGHVPCTPQGIMKILERMGCDPDGKTAVVVGRSRLVGAPVARLLQNANATVTVCHSHTKNLKEICRSADILVAAIGKPEYITAEYVKEGAYVVDVGVNRKEDGHLCGDVDFEAVKDIACAITPVPKGVGPMTICSLMQNTLNAYRRKI